MSKIKLHNSKVRKKELFEPIDPSNVRMYLCGPTVYDRAHLGNARNVIVFDVLFRFFREIYGEHNVKYVRNFTDIDDKINQRAKDLGKEIKLITDETIAWYLEDMELLGNLLPNEMPRATNYVAEMIIMIENLIKSGHAYEAESHVLFSVESYKDYGALSGRSIEDMIAGARVEIAPYKANPLDFVLWKPSSDDLPGWESPWGRGRPGWHLECSAMSHDLLGDTFDIHGGGNDLIFPHHENEIAQSKCCFPSGGFANFWLHNEMLQVDGKKMSKSLGNFFTVRDLIEKGFPGEVIRFVFLSTHYRKPMDWTELKANQADSTLRRWYDMCSNLEEDLKPSAEAIEVLSDDLNTPAVIALLHKHFQSKNFAQLKADANLIGLITPEFKDWAFDFDLSKYEEALMEVRSEAMITKNFDHLDDLKDKLSKAGVEIQMSTDTVKLVPTLKLDLAKLERIL
jgi:cysteinyl-tRNA synthetase